MTPQQRARDRRAVVAASLGNALEWFDIIVYGSFAVVISELSSPRATPRSRSSPPSARSP
ncbi:hypothetical protein GCM10009584_30030 [Ornithinimicrobium humiphilum]|uniref:hypothetical protein n=1 Tax=Ornithinimicrobium humiphilum TaxID=125288 RepID=UPI001EE25D17|nr:hypothetical protein [Ornithinimicrobium humiphilum]